MIIKWKNGSTRKINRKNKKLYRIIDWLIALINQQPLLREKLKDFIITNQIPNDNITVDINDKNLSR